MSKLQIIYTPNADDFRLSDIEKIGWQQPGSPAVQNLRTNYQKLREKFQNLPLEVGVITSQERLKKYSRKKLKELKDAAIVKSTTTYMPLDILRKTLELRSKDLTDPLVGEYVYRTLDYLMCNSSLTLDKSLIQRMTNTILLGPCMPLIEGVQVKLQKVIEEVQKTKNFDEQFDKIGEEMIKIRKMYPTWDDFNALYEHISQRFKANKVSESFPLYFFPPENCLSSLYSVSLLDEIETPECIPKILEWIKKGCEVRGLKEIPEDVKRTVMIGQKDKFGETKMIGSLEKLLNQLPESKTIITDLYIADHFPQLAEIGFDSYEFKLSA